VLYEYEGTAFDCFLGFANATPEQCSTAASISLWLHDDNTLDKVTYRWDGVAEYWPYGHTVIQTQGKKGRPVTMFQVSPSQTRAATRSFSKHRRSAVLATATSAVPRECRESSNRTG
jgi:hypothetical protein